MLFSTKEIEALLLLRWCHFIPIGDFSSVFSKETVQTLQSIGFLGINEKYNACILINQGSLFLSRHFDHIPPPTRRTYRISNVIRRIDSSRFTLCAYRAGLSVFSANQSDIEAEGTYYLTALSRITGSNPWGSTRIMALIHLGNMICGVYPIGSDDEKMSLNDELTALNNNTARFSCKRRGIIFSGDSYEAIQTALSTPTEHPEKSKYISFGDAYARTSLPTFLIPWNETGALQMHMMRHPDFRTRMTAAALGSHWVSPPKEHPEWDAVYDNMPLIMAADMDLRRIGAAILRARSCGCAPVCLAALRGQTNILKKLFKADALVKKVLSFSMEKEEIRRELTLYAPPDSLYTTAEGGALHAPPIKAVGKAGGSDHPEMRELVQSP